jgi:hypothetical protein
MESSWWVRVHQLGLRLLGLWLWKPLIIELFSQLKLNKIENENCIEIWGRSWCSRKAVGKSDLTEFISQVSEPRCGRY